MGHTWPSSTTGHTRSDLLGGVNGCSTTSSPGNRLIIFCGFRVFFFTISCSWMRQQQPEQLSPHLCFSENNLPHSPRPASSQQHKPWGQGEMCSRPEKLTSRESELTPVANLHLVVDLIKQGGGTRGKFTLTVFSLAATPHLIITTFLVSAADVTEHKVCVSEAPRLWLRGKKQRLHQPCTHICLTLLYTGQCPLH